MVYFLTGDWGSSLEPGDSAILTSALTCVLRRRQRCYLLAKVVVVAAHAGLWGEIAYECNLSAAMLGNCSTKFRLPNVSIILTAVLVVQISNLSFKISPLFYILDT